MTIPNGTQITIRDAALMWRNFEGRETKFKPAGPDARSFNVVLTQEQYEEFHAGGLNVRMKDAREEYDEDEPLYTLQIAVGYKQRPPRVVMITSSSRVNLGEDSVGVVDWVDIGKVDLIFRCAHWDTAGKTGIKCWLKTMFITINEDELEMEYGINNVTTASLEDVGHLGDPPVLD
jgi:hypothetical protein